MDVDELRGLAEAHRNRVTTGKQRLHKISLIGQAEMFERAADEIERLRAALEGYRAAVSYIGADSWDGCSDCIEILRAARAADFDWHWTVDETATALKRLRARTALSTDGGEGG